MRGGSNDEKGKNPSSQAKSPTKTSRCDVAEPARSTPARWPSRRTAGSAVVSHCPDSPSRPHRISLAELW